MAAAGRGRVVVTSGPLEGELDRLAAEVGLEVRGHVDVGRLAGGVLDDQKQLGHDLDDVAGLEDKITLATLHPLGRQAPGNVGLATQLSSGACLKADQ